MALYGCQPIVGLKRVHDFFDERFGLIRILLFCLVEVRNWELFVLWTICGFTHMTDFYKGKKWDGARSHEHHKG